MSEEKKVQAGQKVVEKKISLFYPVEGKTEVTLRRPLVTDILVSQQAYEDAPNQEVCIISILTGISEETIRDMDGGDYLAIQKELNNFLLRRYEEEVS